MLNKLKYSSYYLRSQQYALASQWLPEKVTKTDLQ